MNTNEIDKLSLVKAHALFETGDINKIHLTHQTSHVLPNRGWSVL